MFISMNWISDFVDLSGVNLKELIGRFTLATAEVEDIYEYGKNTNDVVVGKIISVENHPESKKLHLLKVDNGTQVVDCVCGAPNVFEGAFVAFAKEGGNVAGNPIIAAKVAGYTSYGMCCSEKELGISEDHTGIMILNDYVEANNIKIGTDIKSFIPLDDTVFEVDNKSLTNRPDLWGHYGIAREIAALVKRPLKPLQVLDTTVYNNLSKLDMKIETELCYRYSCIAVENVTKQISPYDMKVRLMYCGQRPINLLADLTNYLMLELGQPMHAFDKTKVNKVRIKTFDTPKKFKTLDNADRMIEPGIITICDDEEPVALAGIMGGLLSEITDDTTTLMLESANFDGVQVRRSATKLGMRTEASARYEKTLDPEMTVPAIERFLKLLTTIDNGVRITSALTDEYVKKFDTIEITFDKAYVDKYTGIDISSEQIVETLTALDFKVNRNGDSFDIVVPSFRATKDVTMKADIIEEITRIYGYDNFNLQSTKSLLAPVRPDVNRENEYRIKQLLADKYSFSETHSYIWYDSKLNKDLNIVTTNDVRIINSVTAENDAIRNSIIPALLGVVNKNLDDYDEMNVFEIGRVVRGLNAEGLCNERKVLSIVCASKNKTENQLLSECKEIIEHIAKLLKNKPVSYMNTKEDYSWIHPKNSATINVGDSNIGYMSVLNPMISDKIDKKCNVALMEIDYAQFAGEEIMPLKFKEVSKFPGIYIDLSLLVDKYEKFGKIKEIVMSANNAYLQECEYIGTFADDTLPAGKSSLTVRLWFQSYEGTLSGEEVNRYVSEILEKLSKKDISMR